MNTAIRVWLVEDNQPFRRALRRALEQENGLVCDGEFARCEDAWDAMAHDGAPQAILIDLGLPGIDGIAALPRFRELAPSTALLVLTVFEEEEKILRALSSGASGYLLKTSSLEEIARAIRDALAGGAPMTPRMARYVVDRMAQLMPLKRDYGLTAREKQMLDGIVQGKTKKEIAAALEVSFHTVDTHLRNIYRKLVVNTRTAAVAKAMKDGLV
jgi:DNA-binding NarL/FixJ family response regulator